jgi:RHS repeat-associated protein
MKVLVKQAMCVLFIVSWAVLNAQTQTENYIQTKTYKVESQIPLMTNNPTQVNKTIQYFDGLGRATQSVIVKGGSLKYGNNDLPYDWTAGAPTNSGFYNLNASVGENQIVSGLTPFGDTDLLWQCVPSGNGSADGGWKTDALEIDHTKAYRYTVWVKKTGNLSSGVTQLGTEGVNNLNGTPNSNALFYSSDPPQLDTWYLMVGYIHPSDYTGGSQNISGLYDVNGMKVQGGFEYKWDATTTQSKFRSYLFVATDTSVRQYFWSPVVQKIDGNQDSIDDLIATTGVLNNQELLAKDIVTHVEYDQFGRQGKEYLPYASANTDGRFEDSAKDHTESYYFNHYAADFPNAVNSTNVNAYSEKVFENSPLNRVLEQTAPGEDWIKGSGTISGKGYSNGHSIKVDYETNVVFDQVRLFNVTTTFSNQTYFPSLLGGSTFYDTGELSKTVTKDENWTLADGLNKTVEEFKDKNGQVVLERTYNNSQIHDTYYIYDDYGNLTYVLPPKVDTSDGISTNELNELCYQYVYDYRNRLVEKKIPGKGWEYIVYDPLDRPVLTQDALQRQSNNWLFTKYDALGRVAYTGEYTNTSSRSSLQHTVSSQSATNLYEDTVTLSPSVLGGEKVYYTNRSFPSSTNVEIFTITYYDTYLDLPSGLTPPTLVYQEPVTTKTQGLTTVSKVRVLDPSAVSGQADWITTVTYFDQKARPLYVYTQNEFLETTDIVESKLDFTGKVLQTTTTHQKGGIVDDIVTIDRFEYDHMDRLIGQTQKVNDLVTERIVRNTYDDLGQLKTKLTGNGTQKGYTDVTNGLTISDDMITKSSGSCWTTGLATLGSFQAEGYVEYTVETNTTFMVGLSASNADAAWQSIDYAIYNQYNNIIIYEKGLYKGTFQSSATDDVFRIERIGNQIHYKQNGETFYISESLSYGVLLGDVSMCAYGQIKNLHIVDNSKGLQNVDYAYNVRGWLKSINDDAQNDNDLFDFSLRYNDPTGNVAPLFNGNISQTSWSTASANTTSNPVSNLYTYSYDAFNRITSAIDNTGNYNLSLVDYDKNGNILTLQRRGAINSSATLFDLMDNLSYTYDSGNKLIQVDDSSGVSEGFKDVSGTDYTYDENGNMVSDNNKGISSISYNHLNLPTSVGFAGQQAAISYVYDATGVKQKKIVAGSGISTITTEYAGNYVYEKVGAGNNELQFFNHGEGYVKQSFGNFEFVYQYKDHLGNVRLSYIDTNLNGEIEIAANTGGSYSEIIEESNYYPFGLKHQGYNSVVSSNGNALGQKEKTFQDQRYEDDLGLNWYAFKYRNHDPSIGRFFGIDPLAEKYAYNSTYAFSENKVIMYNELEGLETGPAYWMVHTPSGRQAGVTPTSWQKLYSVDNETESYIAMATVGAVVAGAAISAYGIVGTLTYLAEEGVESAIEGATGFPIITDPVDLVQNALKKGFKKVSGKSVNKTFIDGGGMAPYDEAFDVVEGITEGVEKFVRVHGDGNVAGSWMMKASEIKGLSAEQIKDKFSLPSLPTKISDVSVPSGTNIRTGVAGKIDGWGNGGGTQVEVLDRVQPSWISNTRNLTQ